MHRNRACLVHQAFECASQFRCGLCERRNVRVYSLVLSSNCGQRPNPSQSFSRMDLAMATPMRRQHMSQRQVHSYDVMCQFKKNFHKRIGASGLVPANEIPDDLDQKVPVWHLGSHIAACMDENSLRTTALVGRTWGEGVETIWSVMNDFKYSTREMGFGHRRDTLTDVFNNWNFGKAIGEGEVCKLWAESDVDCETARVADRLARECVAACREYEVKEAELSELEHHLGTGRIATFKNINCRLGKAKYRPRERKGEHQFCSVDP